jgi:hypothetical protein
MYYSQQTSFEQNRFKTFHIKWKDSITSLSAKLVDADYFSLENNQNAQDYFDDKTTGKYISYEKLIPLVTNSLLDFNSSPNGNPYVGFDKMNDKKFIINKIKLLNHRWVIADFNNGDIWGEVILKYFLNDDGTVSFETAESVIYPKQ